MRATKTFKAYWIGLTADQKRSLARALSTNTAYLSQIAHGHRSPSPKLTMGIERETGINRGNLRPDIYGRVSKSTPQAQVAT